jgi:nucleotide-binding universal stress UspA family protein
MFKRILAAVNLTDTETGKTTLATAANLAQLSGANIRLIHVRYILEEAMIYVPKDVLERDEKDAIRRLQDLAHEIDLPASRISVESPLGRVYAEVVAAAEQFSADLIVIGPHRPSMAKFLLGTDAGRIVHHSPISVLVVR